MNIGTDLPVRHAEQITATVIFADLVGFSRLSEQDGSEAAYLATTQLLRLLDGIARKHGGSVDKYLGDKLMAVFGYPVPIENAAAAACHAALEMRQRVRDYDRDVALSVPFDVHMGVNTGELMGGDIRGPVVREFHVLGDAVNVAARLNAKAPGGQIWVGPRTFEEARSEFEWDALEPLRLKGKSHSVPAWALRRAAGHATQEQLGFDGRVFPELVGRSGLLEMLRRRVGALCNEGPGGALLLRGEAGSGKSRLLAALGECDELAGLAIRQVRGAPGAEIPDLPAGDDPQLLVVEDLQSLGDVSLDRLRTRVDEAGSRSLLVLMTGRPGPGTERLETRAECIDVPALSPDEARTLAVAALGDPEDEPTIALVLERGGVLPGPLLQAAFLAPALRSEREQDEQRETRTSEAERRRASVVFADLTGFTAMTEKVGASEAYPVVASCLQILDDVAREHGGTVDHYLGDCVMALFGVPRAIEDAPRAALNAAIDMRRRIRAFNEAHELPVPVDVHTGVATGLGIAGDISGPLIREFAVMGDHVDRADELTHEAEGGQIFLDDATHRAARDVFEFAPAGSFAVSGSAEPMPVQELLSTTPQLHRAGIEDRQVSSQLVGRDEPLAALRAGLARVAGGRGGILELSAEAGVGKSRLLAELRSAPEVDEVRWLEGRSISTGRNLSYHPIADLLRSAAGIDDDDDDAEARRKLDAVTAVLPAEAVDAPALLAQLMGAVLSDDERRRLDAIQGDAAEKLLRGAFLQWLRSASTERPVVFVMEDFHWADLSSLELVESLLALSESAPILFLNAFRPDFAETSGRVSAFVCERFGPDHVTAIELAPLDASAARAMVKNLFRGGDVPQATRAAIEERAHGNPFYIEEVVRNLLDAGAVELRDGRFHATAELRSVTIPDTVQEAVMARVDRLDLARKSVLQAASVIGGIFHVEVLEEMVGEAGLRERLTELERGEFIVPSDRTAGEEFAFKHPLIQEVTYDALLVTKRQELHLAVAEATEARLSETLPGFAAMMAFHFSIGRDANRAEAYLFRAGDEAARSAASNEALHFFEEASALYQELHPEGGDPDKRAHLQKSLAVALMNRGRLIEACDHFDQATALLGSSSPRGTLRMGASFAWNLSTVLARLYTGRALGRRPASDRDRELIDVMFRRAMAQATTDPMRFFVDATTLVRTVSARDPMTVPESAAIYSGIVAIFSFGGISFDVGRRFLEVAQGLADRGAIDERVLYFQTLRLLHNLLVGDWSEEHVVGLDLVEEGLREGRFWEASTYLDADTHRRVYQGDYTGAWERVRKLAEIEELYGHDLASSSRQFYQALIHIERHEFDDAVAPLEEYYDEHSEVLFNMVASSLWARLHALRGDLEAAEEASARARALEKEAGRAPPLHASYAHSARFMVDVLALERAAASGGAPSRDLVRRARASRRRALATAGRVAIHRAEVFRLAGREAALVGRAEEALASFGKAIDCAEKMGARPQLARTLADAGRALRTAPEGGTFAGRDPVACFAEAQALFEELDLRDDLAQLPTA